MKAILLSGHSQHAYNIMIKKKLYELRTKIPKGYVGWVYWYVTKSYPLLNYIDDKYKLMDRKNHTIFHNIGMYEFYSDNIHLNGTIPFRFWFDEYDVILNQGSRFIVENKDEAYTNKLARESCLDYVDLKRYLKDKNGYAWHIKKLEIFDKPMQLSEFYKPMYSITNVYGGKPLTKAPKSYQYVWVKEN